MKTRVKKIRLALGMNQKDLAERTGISNNYLSELENEKKDFDVGQLHRISQVFNCDIRDLLVSTKEHEGQSDLSDQTKPVVIANPDLEIVLNDGWPALAVLSASTVKGDVYFSLLPDVTKKLSKLLVKADKTFSAKS